MFNYINSRISCNINILISNGIWCRSSDDIQKLVEMEHCQPQNEYARCVVCVRIKLVTWDGIINVQHFDICNSLIIESK